MCNVHYCPLELLKQKYVLPAQILKKNVQQQESQL